MKTDAVIYAGTATATAKALAPTIITTSNFAGFWYKDALNEARSDTREDIAAHVQARRREVVFSVHCAESYLVEWTVGILMQRHSGSAVYDAARQYFGKPSWNLQGQAPAFPEDRLSAAIAAIERCELEAAKSLISEAIQEGQQRAPSPVMSHIEKWITVPARLIADGVVSGKKPRYNKANSDHFQRLIGLRNDITHADISLPVVIGPSDAESRRERTTSTELVQLPSGWAVKVVAERIRRLHKAFDNDAPDWLVDP